MPDIKPKLVDYSLIHFPKKKASVIQKRIVTQDNSKLYINLLMIVVLAIGAYILYTRLKNKEDMINEHNANVLFLNEYITNFTDEGNIT